MYTYVSINEGKGKERGNYRKRDRIFTIAIASLFLKLRGLAWITLSGNKEQTRGDSVASKSKEMQKHTRPVLNAPL